MKRGEWTKWEPLVRAPKREVKVREVMFPVEQEAPALASEATATATSSSSALIAMGVRRQLVGHRAAKLASQQMEPSLSAFPDLHTYHKGMAKSSTTR